MAIVKENVRLWNARAHGLNYQNPSASHFRVARRGIYRFCFKNAQMWYPSRNLKGDSPIV